MAVLMPISAPSESTSAPPELPKLIGASVWMKSSNVVMPSCPAGGGADDAVRHRLREPERIADGEDDVADLKLIGAPEGDHRQIR